MTKHSKNNTASSIFSYAEYKKLDYGTKKVCILQLYAFPAHFRSNDLVTNPCGGSIRARYASPVLGNL